MYILLVEDEPEHAILLKQSLEKSGHTVDHAATKDKAVALLRTNKYDVAAIDFVLVASTGDTVAQAAFARGIGVVMMTAAEERSTIDDIMASLELQGCKVSCILRKKFMTPKILILALEQAYRTRPLQEEKGG